MTEFILGVMTGLGLAVTIPALWELVAGGRRRRGGASDGTIIGEELNTKLKGGWLK